MTTAKRATIRDVAERAGASVGTVSGVLNGDARYAPEMRRRVWEAATALSYVANRQARHLRAGGTGETRPKSGIILHITHLGGATPIGNSFEANRSQLLAWEAGKLGLYPISYWYYQLEGFQCPPVINGHIDGAIVGTPHIGVVEALRGLLPMVLMDVPFAAELADVPMVNCDMRQGLMQLCARLHDLGHRRIGTIYTHGSPEALSSEPARVRELAAAAAAYGIEIAADCQPAVDISPTTHEAVMASICPTFVRHIRAGEITAIVCPNPSYTDSFARLLPAAGLRVPEDVSLAGTRTSLNVVTEDITAVVLSWPKMIRASLQVLNGLIGGEDSPCREYLVPPEFVNGRTLAAPATTHCPTEFKP